MVGAERRAQAAEDPRVDGDDVAAGQADPGRERMRGVEEEVVVIAQRVRSRRPRGLCLAQEGVDPRRGAGLVEGGGVRVALGGELDEFVAQACLLYTSDAADE